MAIVIHPSRATRHWHGPGVRQGERIYHVLSDLHGEEGSRELRAFAQRYGLQARWVQYPGTYREHHDVPEHVGLRMLADGARQVTNRELGRLLAAKRASTDDGAKGGSRH
jgi:hypothetical protein